MAEQNTDSFVVSGARSKLYEGATTGRRLGFWGTRAVDPTEEATQDLTVLRNRLRQLRRDNAWINRAKVVDASNVIGTGIRPIPATSNKKFNESVSKYWEYWENFADFIRTDSSIYTIQKVMQDGKREAGECFLVTKRLRPDRTSLPVPIQFQMLESDFCPIHLTKPLSNNREIVNGVELDGFGRVRAYYFYKKHPDSYDNLKSVGIDEYDRVPARDVCHYFEPERPNQLRGIPKGTSSIVTSKTFDDYNDAELVRKESRSSFTGTIERERFDESDYKFNPISGEPLDYDSSDVPMLNLQSGTFQALLAGEKLNLFDADDNGQGYKDYQMFQLLQIAASHGVPYQLLSGDWKDINDRVWRAISNQYQREIQQIHELLLIPKVCDRVYRAFIDRGVVAGIFDVSVFDNKFEQYKVEHKPQAWLHIHPEQELNTMIKKLQAGLTTRKALISKFGEKGVTVESIDKDRSEDAKRESKLNLKSLATHDKLDGAAVANNPKTQPKGNDDVPL